MGINKVLSEQKEKKRKEKYEEKNRNKQIKVSTDILEELCDVEQEAPEEHRALLALVCTQSAHRHRCGRAHAEAQQQAQQYGAGEICAKRKKRENLRDPRSALRDLDAGVGGVADLQNLQVVISVSGGRTVCAIGQGTGLL